MNDTTNVIGIDEAGRGPVMGPLVVGLVCWDEPDIPDTVPLADSKQLSPEQRQQAYDVITNRCVHKVLSIPAWVISSRPESLPTLEQETICRALNGMKSYDVVCDRLSTGEVLHNQIRNRCPDRQFQFETGADEHYDAVAAASILAKVTRDRAMEYVAGEWGNVGSGYPSDPSTKSWLKKQGQSDTAWPSMVRTNWSTVKNIEAKLNQTELFNRG